VQRKIVSINVPAMRLFRERRGVSLHDLAKRTGISASSLSRYENGTYIPRLDDAQAIADALDIPITEIWEVRLGKNQHEPVSSMR
jgi:transcriptional regulator with XRE-family HTH domain